MKGLPIYGNLLLKKENNQVSLYFLSTDFINILRLTECNQELMNKQDLKTHHQSINNLIR